MEERKVNSKRKSLDALLSITKQLDDKEVRRVADICQGMVLAKAALSSNEKLKRKEEELCQEEFLILLKLTRHV